jgi:hypothetical protein
LVQNNSDQVRSGKINPEVPEEELQVQEPFYQVTDRDTETGEVIEDTQKRMASGKDTRGGDLNSNRYQSKVTGEEAVGGLTPTPGQNVTQNLQDAAGISSAQKEPVQTTDKLERRDDSRWELDPKSSEDYDRRKEK